MRLEEALRCLALRLTPTLACSGHDLVVPVYKMNTSSTQISYQYLHWQIFPFKDETSLHQRRSTLVSVSMLASAVWTVAPCCLLKKKESGFPDEPQLTEPQQTVCLSAAAGNHSAHTQTHTHMHVRTHTHAHTEAHICAGVLLPSNQNAGRCGRPGVAELSVVFLLIIFISEHL